MPLYEYKCRDCGAVTEFLIRGGGAGFAPSCSRCRSANMDKLVSAPAGVRIGTSPAMGATCCGRDERCAAPPCSSGGTCRRD
ncbi:MAG: zinc ribbon domain-containing protein [Candidatus Aminicenantes bacterium]|nr:zinc ribbon domain-containing protein [Candidatus Aminicenantes bacterium]